MDNSEIKSNDEKLNNTCHEPLGYQDFLCDVNIEYNLGGGRSGSTDNRHCFKLKYLPYMIKNNDIQAESNSVTSSNSSICDSQSIQGSLVSSPIQDSRLIDVTKETCAFLGNSEFVPNDRFKHRRVVLELISAKLSQSTTYNLSTSSSHTGLVTFAGRPRSHDANHSHSRGSNHTSSSSSSIHYNDNHAVDGRNNNGNNLTSSTTTPLLSSKRFVNYTLLIKTTPGLDSHPAVIERRFSDFQMLYQGLKSHEAYAKIIDKFVTFPKKVYMGNFSLTNIAERSILFSRLLDLCASRANLLWSVPFVSFLLDKELKEAHRLTLCGDPDDVQALLETAYYIEQKLYLSRIMTQPGNSSSISSEDTSTTSSERNSQESGNQQNNSMLQVDVTPSPNNSLVDTSEKLNNLSQMKLSSVALNQRILVTFCMLFLTYFRGENYRELKLVVQGFSQLISSEDYVVSINQTHHHMTLRACLLFLMNMNKGGVIDESQRVWLKQRLEDIDGSQMNSYDSLNESTLGATEDINVNNTENNSRNNLSNQPVNSNANVYRITKNDLTSLLKDRNFCSFQDGKFTR